MRCESSGLLLASFIYGEVSSTEQNISHTRSELEQHPQRGLNNFQRLAPGSKQRLARFPVHSVRRVTFSAYAVALVHVC